MTCSGTIPLTSPLVVGAGQTFSLTGTDQTVILDGQNQTQIFVDGGGTLTLSSLYLVNGAAFGSTPKSARPGAPGTSFSGPGTTGPDGNGLDGSNGGPGGTGTPGKRGGDAKGGAIEILGGTTTLTNVTVRDSSAIGGVGGTGGNGGQGGNGENGGDGAVLSVPPCSVGPLGGETCATYLGNGGNGGPGGAGGNAGAGGDGGRGLGGAIYNDGALTVIGSSFTDNSAVGAEGGQGGVGGAGGQGGSGGNGAVNASPVCIGMPCGAAGNGNNGAKGGMSGQAGPGGDALGGAIYNDVAGQLNVQQSELSDNSVTGGAGGLSWRGGPGGPGGGGGDTCCYSKLGNAGNGGNGGMGGPAGAGGRSCGGAMNLEQAAALTRDLTLTENSTVPGVNSQPGAGGGQGFAGFYRHYVPDSEPDEDGRPGTNGTPGQAGLAANPGTATSPDVCGTTAPISYVAVGDSVASGEGLNYGFKWLNRPVLSLWSTGHPATAWDDPPPQDCHRSVHAYPYDLVHLLPSITMHGQQNDLGCTGSTANAGLLGPRVFDDSTPPGLVAPPQIGMEYDSASPFDAARPGLVTITVGANDIGFSNIVAECYGYTFLSYKTNQPDCAHDPTILASLDGLFTAQQSGLEAVLGQIYQHAQDGGYPPPLVAVTEYYNPFPQPYNASCIDTGIASADKRVGGGIGITPGEQAWLTQQLNRLDDGIGSVVNSYAAQGAVAVDLRPVFAGHEWCTQDPWVFGPSVAIRPYGKNKAPFHPTSEGSTAIADAIANALGSSATLDANGTVITTSGGTSVTANGLSSSGYTSVSDTAATDSNNQSIVTHAPFAAQRIIKITRTATVSSFAISTPAVPDAHGNQPQLYELSGQTWTALPSSFANGVVTSVAPGAGIYASGTPAIASDGTFIATGAGAAPSIVSFSATASDASSTFSWQFGDGTTGTGKNVSHTYDTAGTYNVQLVTTSSQNASSVSQQTVTIASAPPTVAIKAPTHTLTVGTTAAFHATTTGDAATSTAFWDFGDGTGTPAAVGFKTSHAYAQAGHYTATVIVIDDQGNIAMSTRSITVS